MPPTPDQIAAMERAQATAQLNYDTEAHAVLEWLKTMPPDAAIHMKKMLSAIRDADLQTPGRAAIICNFYVGLLDYKLLVEANVCLFHGVNHDAEMAQAVATMTDEDAAARGMMPAPPTIPPPAPPMSAPPDAPDHDPGEDTCLCGHMRREHILDPDSATYCMICHPMCDGFVLAADYN